MANFLLSQLLLLLLYLCSLEGPGKFFRQLFGFIALHNPRHDVHRESVDWIIGIGALEILSQEFLSLLNQVRLVLGNSIRPRLLVLLQRLHLGSWKRIRAESCDVEEVVRNTKRRQVQHNLIVSSLVLVQRDNWDRPSVAPVPVRVGQRSSPPLLPPPRTSDLDEALPPRHVIQYPFVLIETVGNSPGPSRLLLCRLPPRDPIDVVDVRAPAVHLSLELLFHVADVELARLYMILVIAHPQPCCDAEGPRAHGN
mmetsp:Transcript_24030/g.78178  ORF Transcript_24030/g.78178 Transcript_24030/m.78178 type:complete len:254 (+) Transcript_24030:883-1644(+)